MMLAQIFPDLGLSEGVLHIVRIIAAVGGAVVGWFGCDPLTRLTYRVWYNAAVPGPLLFTTKASAAAILSVAIYVFLPLGGGGGLGFGPGQGGTPGKGPGPGGGKDTAAKDATPKDARPPTKNDPDVPLTKTGEPRERIDIEILGGQRFQDDGKYRYYYLKKTQTSMSYPELRDYFAKHRGKLLVKIVLTPESVSFGMEEDDPTRRLRKLMDTYEQHRDPQSTD